MPRRIGSDVDPEEEAETLERARRLRRHNRAVEAPRINSSSKRVSSTSAPPRSSSTRSTSPNPSSSVPIPSRKSASHPSSGEPDHLRQIHSKPKHQKTTVPGGSSSKSRPSRHQQEGTPDSYDIPTHSTENTFEPVTPLLKPSDGAEEQEGTGAVMIWYEAARDAIHIFILILYTFLTLSKNAIPGCVRAWILSKLRTIFIVLCIAVFTFLTLREKYCTLSAGLVPEFFPFQVTLPGCSVTAPRSQFSGEEDEAASSRDSIDGWVSKFPNSYGFIQNSMGDVQIRSGNLHDLSTLSFHIGLSNDKWEEEYKKNIEWAKATENKFTEKIKLLWNAINYHTQGFPPLNTPAMPSWKFWASAMSPSHAVAEKEIIRLEAILKNAKADIDAALEKDFNRELNYEVWTELLTKGPLDFRDTLREIRSALKSDGTSSVDIKEVFETVEDSSDIWQTSSKYMMDLLEERWTRLEDDSKWLSSRLMDLMEEHNILNDRSAGSRDESWYKELLLRNKVVALAWRARVKEYFVSSEKKN
ncbi:hypothetical protein G7046_g6904 [Stylonectria norvegica]|nr:hypothetical protein G7046_g6904 [Stylonectria norvegica]